MTAVIRKAEALAVNVTAQAVVRTIEAFAG